FFFIHSRDHLYLLSFPTRRSSDLILFFLAKNLTTRSNLFNSSSFNIVEAHSKGFLAPLEEFILLHNGIIFPTVVPPSFVLIGMKWSSSNSSSSHKEHLLSKKTNVSFNSSSVKVSGKFLTLALLRCSVNRILSRLFSLYLASCILSRSL